MNANLRKAYKTLKRMRCPVFDEGEENTFTISGEHNFDPDYGGELWADMYEAECLEGYDFGISPRIHKVLKRNNLYAEWLNGGQVGVFDE